MTREQLALSVLRAAVQKGRHVVAAWVSLSWHLDRKIKRMKPVFAAAVAKARRIQAGKLNGARELAIEALRSYDPMAKAAHAVAYLSEAEQDQRIKPVRMAVEAACRGQAQVHHWRAIFDAINRLDVFKDMPKLLSGDSREFMTTVHAVVIGIMDRQRVEKSRGLKQVERETLQDLLTLWVEVIGAVIHREMDKADEKATEAVRRAIAGHVPKGVRVIEAVA